MECLRTRTPFGRKHGWEIQHVMLGMRHFYRVTGNGWCHPATEQEKALWRMLRKHDKSLAAAKGGE